MPTIETICNQLPTLYRDMLALTTPTQQAIRYTHAHTTKPATETQQERYIREREQLKTELRDLAEIAFTLNDDVNVSWPIDTIAATIKAHAVALAAWPDLLQDLERIHHRWKTLTAPDVEQSNHLCPTCGTANLHWRHQDRLYVCPACEYAGTLEHVHTATIWRIKTSDLWIDRATACTLYDLSRDQLKWHIRAGNLHPRGGLIKTAELRTLPRR
ncbi:hypothetical protein ABZS16_04205 [Trueperella pyogenes]|uniref:hypothetical protein n=1 Tax=Trueperella pyogenes TaxID=1661 RepID=UPI00339D70D9